MVKKFECVGGSLYGEVQVEQVWTGGGGGAGASALYIGSRGQNQGPVQGLPCIKNERRARLKTLFSPQLCWLAVIMIGV